MAVEINGKVYRNLPEQVKKNQEDIESLDTKLKDLNIVNGEMSFSTIANFNSGLKASTVKIGDDTTNLYIAKDASDIIGIYHNNVERIKIGTDKTTSCAANWTPDEDNKYLLGTAKVRWKILNVNSVINGDGNLMIRGNPDINVVLGNKESVGAIMPLSDDKFNIGSTSKVWKAVYTTTIGNATKSINVDDIVTTPTFDSSTVYASGTLDANGQSTIDLSTSGVPTPGLYAFIYGGCQCYVTFTTENIQHAGPTPIIVSCPLLKDGNKYPGLLTISKYISTLTLTVDASVGPASQGLSWSLYKVM